MVKSAQRLRISWQVTVGGIPLAGMCGFNCSMSRKGSRRGPGWGGDWLVRTERMRSGCGSSWDCWLASETRDLCSMMQGSV
jgi:hypothetical protein